MAEVSKIASQGLWVAITIGTITGISLAIACPTLFALMGTSPEVMEYAVPFLRVRCLSSPAIMMTYVMSGVFRGFKDTKATLVSSTWSNIAHIALDAFCIFYLGMGAVGAAFATSISLWLNWSILFTNIVKSGYLKVSDMDTINTEDHLVVKRPDGTLATRTVASLPPPPPPIDTTRNLASDIPLCYQSFSRSAILPCHKPKKNYTVNLINQNVI